eukprot:6491537-Amphidinium_carterae.10
MQAASANLRPKAAQLPSQDKRRTSDAQATHKCIDFSLTALPSIFSSVPGHVNADARSNKLPTTHNEYFYDVTMKLVPNHKFEQFQTSNKTVLLYGFTRNGKSQIGRSPRMTKAARRVSTAIRTPIPG